MRGKERIAERRAPVIFLLVRLALMEVRAMVCLPQETYRSFVSQPSPELTAPAFERGDETTRLRTT